MENAPYKFIKNPGNLRDGCGVFHKNWGAIASRLPHPRGPTRKRFPKPDSREGSSRRHLQQTGYSRDSDLGR